MHINILDRTSANCWGDGGCRFAYYRRCAGGHEYDVGPGGAYHEMSPCDGTGVPVLRWVRLMITYHTTYTFICIQRIGPPPASAAQNSLVFIHLFPRIDHQILRGNKQTKSSVTGPRIHEIWTRTCRDLHTYMSLLTHKSHTHTPVSVVVVRRRVCGVPAWT